MSYIFTSAYSYKAGVRALVEVYIFNYTVEPVYIEHSREMKKCSMYAGVQCIQVLSNWRSGQIETKSRVIRET